MNLKDLILGFTKKRTAAIAKERLQIVVAHERTNKSSADIIPQMRQELLAVINKYYPVDQQDITVELQQDGSCSILELNVTLPQNSNVKEKLENTEIV